jgi:uncharacterized protein (DUF58 family)
MGWRMFRSLFRFSFPMLKALDRRLRRNMTTGGKSLVAVMLFSLLGGIYLETPLLYLFSSVFSLLLLGLVTSVLYRPKLEIHMYADELGQVDQACEAEIELCNIGQRTAFELVIEPEANANRLLTHVVRPSFVSELGAQKSVTLRLVFSFSRRGIYRLPGVCVISSFPFGLFRFRQTQLSQQEIIIAPRFANLAFYEFVNQGRHFDLDKLQESTLTGDREEFFGCREYVPGTPVVRWDYASWARTGRPTVREYCGRQQANAVLFVDNVIVRPRDAARFEAILSLAAAYSDHLTRELVKIDQLCLGEKATELTEPNLRSRQLTIMRKLAEAESTRERRFHWNEQFIDQLELAPGTMVFVLLLQWDSERMHCIDQLRALGLDVIPILVNDDGANIGEGADAMVVTVSQIATEPEGIRAT